MKVTLLTEGGKNLGFGHLSRCLSLCQAFERKGIYPEMIVNGDNQASSWLGSQKHRLMDWTKDFNNVVAALPEQDIIIIDSYLADQEVYSKATQITACPVFFDDTQRLYYPQGCIVNTALQAEKLSYGDRPQDNCFLGPAFALLRREFWDIAERPVRETVQDILITFGGNDSRRMTPKVLSLLNQNYPSLRQWVVIGKGFEHQKDIESIKTDNVRLLIAPDAPEMKAVMARVDIAVSSTGQTVNELARMGVPAIGISVADNQRGAALAWQQQDFLAYAGHFDQALVMDQMIKRLRDLEPFDQRQKISRLGQDLVDGQGAVRLADALIAKAKVSIQQ